MSGLMVIGQNCQFWKLKQIELGGLVKLMKVEGCHRAMDPFAASRWSHLTTLAFFGADRFETDDQITFMNSYLFLAVSQYQLLALT